MLKQLAGAGALAFGMGLGACSMPERPDFNTMDSVELAALMEKQTQSMVGEEWFGVKVLAVKATGSMITFEYGLKTASTSLAPAARQDSWDKGREKLCADRYGKPFLAKGGMVRYIYRNKNDLILFNNDYNGHVCDGL